MALQTKVIKNKIASVKNIRKITRAMEMVAATKMRKATSAVVASKAYVKRAYLLIQHLTSHVEAKHVLMETPKGADKVLIVAIAGNRGLCGGYNSTIRKTVREYVTTHADTTYSYISIGKHIEKTLKQLPGDIIASFTQFIDSVSEEDLWPINQLVIDEFKKGTYTKVLLFYTRFNSSLSYTPISKHMLPFRKADLEETMDEMHITEEAQEQANQYIDFLFEPETDTVLDFLLPRITEVYIYQALLESFASEHSSRMVAMKNASDNAKKMIETLTVNFNRARQAAITQEIAEISAGSAV